MLYKCLKRPVRVMLALMLVTLFAPSHWPAQVRAADGDLDPSFGNSGIVTTDFLRGGDDQANGVAVQKDGKIVVAGGNSGNFAVARYNADGSLDPTFGDGGRVVTSFGTNISSAQALVLQPDAKIVAAGSSGSFETGVDFAVARYNEDGSLDTSFGVDGKVTTDFNKMINSIDVANAVAVQPADGKIIVAGSTQNSNTDTDFAIVRYNLDGSLDTSFDGDGRLTTSFNNNQHDRATGVVIQPDERIVAIGSASVSFALARYNEDGSIDASFGNGGRVVTSFEASATAVALQPDGKIVLVGTSGAIFSRFALARYNTNGSLDASFGNGGIVITNIGGDFATSRILALQSDGRIVVAGDNQIFQLVARYNSNGVLDTTFGSNGFVFTQFSNQQGGNTFGVAVQPVDDRIIAVGRIRSELLGNNFALARYNPDGSLDISFDGDGKVITDWPGGSDSGHALVIQPDGKIVVAGNDAEDFALARYNPDGSLDTSFGNGGRVTTNFTAGPDKAFGVALQPDGKIIAAGVAAFPFNANFGLARYNTDGSLDNSFGFEGKVVTDFNGGGDEAMAVTVQDDGKIVAAGRANFGRSFGLARYNPDGSLDSSFDGDGRVVTDFGFEGGSALAVVIQPGDGKIVAAGGVASDFTLVRYNTDGSLDHSFDGDGQVVTSFSGVDQARAIALQPDGKIVAAGFTQPGSPSEFGKRNFALARYNPDGSLDTLFGADGRVTTNISDVGDHDEAFGVVIQPDDGKIVAAGFAVNGPAPFTRMEFALARYNSDGSLDTSFGENGTITTNTGNSTFASDQARAVAIQPNDGKIVAVGESFNNGTGIDFALARYGDADTTPPSIDCPSNLQAVTPRPREGCAEVVYPPPVVTDNLPGATVVCSPPSGSCFPAGATTVTCTATDAAGNTSSCGFTVTVFDVVLRSDSDPRAELLINSFTGDYSFCCPELPPGQSPLRGRGQVLARGSTITLSHITQSFRFQASIDAAVGKGSASFKPVSGFVLCPIQDRNIFDNLPVMCGSVSP